MPRLDIKMFLAVLTAAVLHGTPAASAEEKKTSEPQKGESGKGLTVEELGRGLRSAEQNIEKEIPKIGSAIGGAFKKITEKDPDKPESKTDGSAQKK